MIGDLILPSRIERMIAGIVVGDQVFRALDIDGYLVIAVAQGSASSFAMGDNVGKPPAKPRRTPFVAYGKMGALLMQGEPSTGIACTPVDGLDIFPSWMGGVRSGMWIAGLSGLKQEHDLLFAALFLYGAFHGNMILHHVGQRYASEQEALAASTGPRGELAMARPVEDHLRWYREVRVEEGPLSFQFYRETQFFPGGPHTPAIHVDVVVEDPVALLNFLASVFDVKPTLFDDAGEDDPVGVLWITASDGSVMGVMARSQWWDPQQV